MQKGYQLFFAILAVMVVLAGAGGFSPGSVGQSIDS